MVTVAATELKKNFKTYAGKVSSGEVIYIKRPGKEKNLILINEQKYQQAMRLLEYFTRLNGYDSYEDFIKREQEIQNAKYNRDFLELFASMDEIDLERPAQGNFTHDNFREVM